MSNRKQFIQINEEENTELEAITCGVLQDSILGPLLFLMYVNDLRNATNLLDPTMYADDTNLFLNIKILAISLKRRIFNYKESINSLFQISCH